ncbi:MAG TPA: short-chain dehydrogenase [Acidimicrobiaceae bacterium]|nr:short-chain dehydrogenase [Acidimicrobiaceae bacterium]
MGWNRSDIGDLRGRTAVVTGANSGLGLESARALAAAGARVLLACRDAERARGALDSVATEATGAEPEVVRLDLADLDSVTAAAEDVAGRVDRLDILLNNAGVMAIPLRRTAQGHEAQFGTNHLGHFALTGRLLPVLLAAGQPRVVTTSSFMHHMGRMRWDDLDWQRGYRKWEAYGQSKLANLLFTFGLDRRARAAGTSLVAAGAHPGYASTELQRRGPEMSGNKVMAVAMGLANRAVAQTPEGGALPQLYAAVSPEVQGGDYLGPGGLFELRGSPSKVRAAKRAYREADAERLWQASEELTGVEYRWG